MLSHIFSVFQFRFGSCSEICFFCTIQVSFSFRLKIVFNFFDQLAFNLTDLMLQRIQLMAQLLSFISKQISLNSEILKIFFQGFKINRTTRLGKTWGRFHKLFFALCPTFEKLFKGVEHALRRAPNFNRAISMIYTLRQTFMKSTPGANPLKNLRPSIFFNVDNLQWIAFFMTI